MNIFCEPTRTSSTPSCELIDLNKLGERLGEVEREINSIKANISKGESTSETLQSLVDTFERLSKIMLITGAIVQILATYATVSEPSQEAPRFQN
jgi:hypothetical protein